MKCNSCDKSESISEIMDRVLEERGETLDANNTVDRFVLEQYIVEQATISDDLDTLCSYILDNGIDVDKIVNILTGIAAMHRIKNDALFDVYCQVFDLEG